MSALRKIDAQIIEFPTRPAIRLAFAGATPPTEPPEGPKGPMHPGEIVRRRMFERLDISQEDFCRHYGFSETFVSRLFSGQTAITVESARNLSEAFNMSPMFFMNLQTQYDSMMRGETRDVPVVKTPPTP